MCNNPKHHSTTTNHTHVCECGEEWGHSEKSIGCEACHTCPRCGKINYVVSEFSSWLDYLDFYIAKLAS
jgi:anaerobic ribonucleoside-triphosphate reductase